MALCLFRCLTACGCRDCLINKLAFYPPSAGYRFEEISTPLKKIKDSVVGSSIPNRQSSCRRSTIQNKDTPRFTSIPSVDSRYYKFILVYEDQELISSREPSQARQEQVNPQNSKQELSEENSQKIQPAISQGKSDVQQKNNKTTAKKKGVPEKREEEFSQVEDLNLICFKRQNRLGTLICGYHIEYTHRRSDMVIIYSHGNSTDIGYMINQALDVAYNLRTNLIAFDYSGYGQSGGKPSEKSCIYDLEAMYLLARELGYSPVNIVLYGQSVGSGPSTFLASQKRFPIGGLIIHSGFASGLRITQDAQKALSSKTSSKDFFPNREFIRKVNAPIMIIHGTDDTDIRMHHANELYAQAKKHYTPSILKVEGAGHNDIEHDDNHRKVYFVKLREFVSFLRKNRNALHEACKGPKEGKSGAANHLGQPVGLEGIDSKEINVQNPLDWKKGYAGDGWGESFNHIYKGLLTLPDDGSFIKDDQDQSGESQSNQKQNHRCASTQATVNPKEQAADGKWKNSRSCELSASYQSDKQSQSQTSNAKDATSKETLTTHEGIKSNPIILHRNGETQIVTDSITNSQNTAQQPSSTAYAGRNQNECNVSSHVPEQSNELSKEGKAIQQYLESDDEEDNNQQQNSLQAAEESKQNEFSDGEEERELEIRSHNATSIARIQYDSYFSAYIIDNNNANSQTNPDSNQAISQSMNPQVQDPNKTGGTQKVQKRMKSNSTSISQEQHHLFRSCQVEPKQGDDANNSSNLRVLLKQNTFDEISTLPIQKLNVQNLLSNDMNNFYNNKDSVREDYGVSSLYQATLNPVELIPHHHSKTEIDYQSNTTTITNKKDSKKK